MDVKQVLVSAWEAVETAGLPERVQAVAFEQAIKLLAAGQQDSPRQEGRATQPDEGGPTRSRTSTDADQRSTPDLLDEEEYFGKFAEESGVSAEKLRGVYLSDGAGSLKIGVARRRLGDSEAERNRNVAILMVGANWFAEGKAALPISDVRNAAKELGYEPSRNLGKHLESVPGTQAVGVKNDKAVRVQGARFDAPFRGLIDRLTGE